MVEFKQSVFTPNVGQRNLGKIDGYPVSADISTLYGVKDKLHPNGHSGLDLAASEGTSIHSPADGIVCDVFVLPNRGNKWDSFKDIFGNCVIIDHGDVYSLYAHLKDRPLVTEQQVIHTGDILGYVGNTGYSFGPHLHWAVAKHDNRYFNWPSEIGPIGVLLNALDYCDTIKQDKIDINKIDKSLALGYIQDIEIKISMLKGLLK